MLNKLSETLRKYANGWLILAALAVEVIFFTQIAPRMQALIPAGPLDLKFFYTPDQAYTLVESYGEAGRAAYRVFDLTADIIHPIAYTLFFGLLLSVLFQRGFSSGSIVQKFNAVPAVSWLFDMFENIGVVTMLSIYPSTPAALAWVTAVCTSIKWIFFLITIALTLIGVVKAAVNRFKIQA